MSIRTIRYALAASASFAAIAGAAPTLAQDVAISSERLANLEEPLATEVGPITVEFAGLIDARVDYDFEDEDGGDDALNPGIIGNFEFNASTQLGNRWNVGVAYFGQYERDEMLGGDGDYTDRIAGFVQGTYGTAFGGEVMDIVREETRRVRGVGNANLAFDDALGAAKGWGGGYVGQFGPSRLSAIVDEDGNYDLGFMYQRPDGANGYRYGMRFTDATYTAPDGLTEFESNALMGTFEYLYSRSIYNLGGGVESLEAGPTVAKRWFVSGGWQRQWGAVTTSLEGHYGEIEGQAEKSAAFGLDYGFARGLSLNLGVNHSDAQVVVDGITILDEKETTATTSLRFGF
ncbi:MAG: hypothetical protein ABJP34_06585 [Erythrobacter sp.]